MGRCPRFFSNDSAMLAKGIRGAGRPEAWDPPAVCSKTHYDGPVLCYFCNTFAPGFLGAKRSLSL